MTPQPCTCQRPLAQPRLVDIISMWRFLNGRNPSVADIAAQCGMTPAEVIDAIEADDGLHLSGNLIIEEGEDA